MNADDWANVLAHQRRKALLREEITPALQRFRAAPATPDDQARVDAAGAELIALTMRNRDICRAKREDRRAEADRLNRTVRDLQGLRRAYGRNRPHRWQSYS
jgi:hypothetical protein